MFGFVISFLTAKATSGSCRCKEFASSRRQVRCTRLPRRLLRSVPLIGEVLDPACPPSQDHYRTTQYLQSTQSAVFILKCISDSEKELLPKGATYFGNKAIAGMTLQILKGSSCSFAYSLELGDTQETLTLSAKRMSMQFRNRRPPFA